MEFLGGKDPLAEDRSVLVPIDDLGKNPYREILAYPKPSDESDESRIRQLKSLGIEGLEYAGPLRIGKLSVLGTRVGGLVVAGISDGGRGGVKIRRVNSGRS